MKKHGTYRVPSWTVVLRLKNLVRYYFGQIWIRYLTKFEPSVNGGGPHESDEGATRSRVDKLRRVQGDLLILLEQIV